MSVDSIERSKQSAEPRELFTVTHGATVYRLTSATRDILHAGAIYTATAMSRGELDVPSVDDDNCELTITLPVNHPLVRRYLKVLVPPQLITCVVHRKFFPSGDTEQIWSGSITSMSCDDDQATLRIPALGADAAQRSLPTLSVGRACPFLLYSAGCNVSRNASVEGLAHKVSTTAMHVNGREIRVDLLDTDRLNDWATGGELVVTSGEATGERMSIGAQEDQSAFSSVVVLSLQFPIPGLKNNDSADIFAGCDHSIRTCRLKFDNKNNFGGYPSLPVSNPFKWER